MVHDFFWDVRGAFGASLRVSAPGWCSCGSRTHTRGEAHAYGEPRQGGAGPPFRNPPTEMVHDFFWDVRGAFGASLRVSAPGWCSCGSRTHTRGGAHAYGEPWTVQGGAGPPFRNPP